LQGEKGSPCWLILFKKGNFQQFLLIPCPIPVNSSFDALEWLPARTPHTPNPGEEMVRYYGFYSNVSRGVVKKKMVMVSCLAS